MPFCNKCGTEVAEGINFCGKCGYALGSGQSTNQNPAPTQTNYATLGGGVGTPFVMDKNMLFRIIGKLGYVFVIIGFCIPVGGGGDNGFQLANEMFDSNSEVIFGLLTILMFISAVVGVLIGILPLIIKNINIGIDWITFAICVVSGLIVFWGSSALGFFDAGLLRYERYVFQSGAYLILIGWIIALGCQIISTFSLDSSNQKPAVSEPDVQGLSDKWVWLLACTPVLSMILGLTGVGQHVVSICFSWAIYILLIVLDVKELKRRYFNLGVWFWLCYILAPIYLFVRAARTNKKYGYAITYLLLTVFGSVTLGVRF